MRNNPPGIIKKEEIKELAINIV